MFSLVLSLCAAFGPSLGNEIPRAWEHFNKAAQSSVSPQELDWQAYYKNSGDRFRVSSLPPSAASSRIQFAPNWVAPTMEWAVPMGVLGSPPSAHPPFPAYGSAEPTAPPKK